MKSLHLFLKIKKKIPAIEIITKNKSDKNDPVISAKGNKIKKKDDTGERYFKIYSVQ